MIKVEVTHLKAPWPAGAVVGSVVLLDVASLPAWAAGKCILVPDGDEREPVGLWEQFTPSNGPVLVVNPAGEDDRKAAESAALMEALELELTDAEQALSTARAEIQSLAAQLVQANAEIERLTAAVEDAHDTVERAEGHLLDAIQERDKAVADLQALRNAVPAVVGTITGDGSGEALPKIEEAKAPATTKATKASAKGAA